MKPAARGVLAFLLISFGLAWGTIAVARIVPGMSLVNPLVQVPIAFSPAIAALVVRRWVTREGFGDSGIRPRLRAAARHYLLAWAGPVLVLAATVGLAAGFGLYHLDLTRLRQALPGTGPAEPAALLLALAAPLLLAPVFWGEEFGWRAYLQRRVGGGPLRAALVTGVIWSVWHYPLVLTDYSSYGNPLAGIGTWTLLMVAQSVILAWLFLRSGSIWVPCVAHAGNNMIISGLSAPLLVEGAGLDPSVVDLVALIPLGAICAWILLSGRLRSVPDAGPAGLGADKPAADGPKRIVSPSPMVD
jgi:membrane protease YdiL (CAAX protease family)